MKRIREPVVQGDVAYIDLTKGYVATIDAADISLVQGHNWHAAVRFHPTGAIKNVYAMYSAMIDGKQKSIPMQRVIVPSDCARVVVDHIDGNGLNNRRQNLRLATVAQNTANQRLTLRNKSGHKGVSWRKKLGKWQAQICIDGKNRHLGLFESVESAANAYETASKQHHGEFSRLGIKE